MDRCWGKTNISLGRPVKLKSLMGVQFPLMGWIGGGGETVLFSGRLSKLKGRVVQQGNFAVKLVQKFYSVSEFKINRNWERNLWSKNSKNSIEIFDLNGAKERSVLNKSKYF